MKLFLQKPPAQSWSAEDWEQLRELAVGRMQRDDLPDDIRLRWGGVALAAISGRWEEGGLSQQGMAAAARVRAYMITEFGVSDSDAVRDLSALCLDVLGCLGLSHEAAVRLAGEWRSLPREHMLRLRRIKNMLTALLPLRAFLEGDGDPALRDMRAWLVLVPRLP